jgi:thioesterase domain-containing protein/acyl carrier protein
MRHPDVEDAALVGQSLYVAPSRDFTGALDRLPESVLTYAQAHLGDRAPETVTIVLAIPRDAAGALDLSRLPRQGPAATKLEPKPAAPSPAPRASDVVEEKVASIWREVLGVEDIGPDAHFFQLGGHSLLAARMLAKVAATFGKRPAMTALFQAPTLRAFASQVAAENPEARIVAADVGPVDAPDWSVIRYGDPGRKARVHGVNHPMLFYGLADALGADCPVLDVHIADMDLRDTPPARFEAIVAKAVAKLVEAQPEGPYALVGLCVDGTAALEAARQLRAAGKTVELVAMIDSWAPRYVRTRPRLQKMAWDIRVKFDRLYYHLASALSGRMSWAAVAKSYNFIWSALTWLKVLKGPTDDDLGLRHTTTYLTASAREYHPPAYDGRVVLFRTESTLRQAYAHLFGWRGILNADTEIVDLKGWHATAFTTEGVKTLSATIQRYLDRAQ